MVTGVPAICARRRGHETPTTCFHDLRAISPLARPPQPAMNQPAGWCGRSASCGRRPRSCRAGPGAARRGARRAGHSNDPNCVWECHRRAHGGTPPRAAVCAKPDPVAMPMAGLSRRVLGYGHSHKIGRCTCVVNDYATFTRPSGSVKVSFSSKCDERCERRCTISCCGIK